MEKRGYTYLNHRVIGMVNQEYPKVNGRKPLVAICTLCTKGIVKALEKL